MTRCTCDERVHFRITGEPGSEDGSRFLRHDTCGGKVGEVGPEFLELIGVDGYEPGTWPDFYPIVEVDLR